MESLNNKTQKILEFFLEGKVENVYSELKESTKEEQLEFLSKVLNLTKCNKTLNINPTHCSVLKRYLKPGKTYSDFLTAWTPPSTEFSNENKVQYFDMPVQVINAQPQNNKQEILSIGLVSSNFNSEQEFLEAAKKYEETEDIREKKLAEVLEPEYEVNLYKVIDVYTLGE